MGIIQNVIKGAGAAVNKMLPPPSTQVPVPDAADQTAPAPWEVAGHALTPASEGDVAGFNYPDIENPTDAAGNPNPYFIPKTDEKGQPNPHYVAAKSVHDAFDALDQLHRTENPHIDFAKEYANIVNEQKQNDEVKPRGNALSAFAIALGGGKEAANQYAATNKEADQTDAEARAKQLQFKKSLVDAHVKELVSQGEWAKALKQNEISAKLEAALKHQEALTAHDFRTQENAQLIQGRTDAAKERGQAGIRAAQARALIAGGGLNPAQLAGYKAQVATNGKEATARLDAMGGINAEDKAAEVHDWLVSENEKAYQHWQNVAAGKEDTKGAAKSMVQLFDANGQPHGNPMSPDAFEKLGGATAAKTHGYTFKLTK